MIRFDFAWGHLSEHVAANEKPTSLRHGQLRLASLGNWYPGQLILFGPFTAHVSIGVSGRELGGGGGGRRTSAVFSGTGPTMPRASARPML